MGISAIANSRSSASSARVHVFLGKGGVGKTTCAAATALQLAEAGERSLVISTDPTPSLSHIFEVEGTHREREVCPGLFLTELGLQDVRDMWNEKFGREVYAAFSAFVDIAYADFVQFVTSVWAEREGCCRLASGRCCDRHGYGPQDHGRDRRRRHEAMLCKGGINRRKVSPSGQVIDRVKRVPCAGAAVP